MLTATAFMDEFHASSSGKRPIEAGIADGIGIGQDDDALLLHLVHRWVCWPFLVSPGPFPLDTEELSFLQHLDHLLSTLLLHSASIG